MKVPGRVALLLLGCFVAGCAAPTQPTPPATSSEITVHGVIDWTAPGTVGPQGAEPPHFLNADDGRRLGLVLSPESSALAQQSSDGRAVSVTGRLEPIWVEPIGPVWAGLVVSSFSFDSP